MRKKSALTLRATKRLGAGPAGLLMELRGLILAAREQVARAVDAGLVTLYWHIGRRIHQDVLKQKRAEYGAKIVSALGTQLSREFGQGFNARNLFRMMRFAEVFPDEQIVSALRTQLGWTHFRMITPIDRIPYLVPSANLSYILQVSAVNLTIRLRFCMNTPEL